MRSRVIPAFKTLIPLFAEKPSHPVVPLGHRTAGARSEGQGRPLAGARALPLTAASTLADWRSNGGREITRYAGLLLAGVLAVAACPVALSAQAAPVTRANPADPYAGFITEASQRFGIPEHWIRAVLRVESAGDVRAISSAGAMGLMQVMPDTWAGLRVRHGLGRDPYD
ncbi:transglycosylase SLT domain-containing protein, partial [uncultured Sphingobium sp.]